MKTLSVVWLTILLLCGVSVCGTSHLDERIDLALDHASTSMDAIYRLWSVDEYPNFLKSCAMQRTGYEMLKYKFATKILAALLGKKQVFTVSYMGTGVTAGHGVSVDDRFTTIVHNLLEPVFVHMGVVLESRNVAMTSIPCMPYGLCVGTIAGLDADIIHWEHTYDCAFEECQHTIEQFVRQALLSPSNPVLVLSRSPTPNWAADECPADASQSPALEDNDREYIYLSKTPGGIMEIITEKNKDVIAKFGYMHNIIKYYKSVAGFQFWDHINYKGYKCRGPYIAHWGKHVAPWNPSVLGHHLRGAHHAYFWLSIWRDSLAEIRQRLKSSENLSTQRLHDEYVLRSEVYRSVHSVPAESLVQSNISDRIRCFTDFEPRAEYDRSLSGLVVADPHSSGWRPIILEEPDLLLSRIPTGQFEYKRALIGNKSSGPLTLLVQLDRRGHVLLCEAPAVWGKVLDDLVHLWESTSVYITRKGDIQPSDFEFNKDDAVALPYKIYHGDSCVKKELCVQALPEINKGEYYITIVPKQVKYVVLATVLIP